MEKQVIALFGEAEKGAFRTPHVLHELPQVMDRLGNPPEASEGLFFAVQAILYNRQIIYFRVEEEGFSRSDYLDGLHFLHDKEKIKQVHAICMPGVGDGEILEASRCVCELRRGLLITSQKDLYDYLTSH
jgi:hypothetical protein